VCVRNEHSSSCHSLTYDDNQAYLNIYIYCNFGFIFHCHITNNTSSQSRLVFQLVVWFPGAVYRKSTSDLRLIEKSVCNFLILESREFPADVPGALAFLIQCILKFFVRPVVYTTGVTAFCLGKSKFHSWCVVFGGSRSRGYDEFCLVAHNVI
jgi:hypothetical protein